MDVRRKMIPGLAFILELLLIVTGCSGGGCPTTSSGSGSGSASAGTSTSGGTVPCGFKAPGGSTGINGACSTTERPINVLYSFDIPTSTSTVANILPFAIAPDGSLTLMCGNAQAALGELALVNNKFLYALDANSATIAAFTIAHSNSGALSPIQGSPFSVADTFQQFHHIVADPLGRFIFLTNFEGNKIDIFLVDQNTGALTLAPNSPVTVTSPIHLAVAPSGNFVYVPNSQAGLINIFRLDSSGTLTAAAPFVVSGGVNDFPLFAVAHPNGKFLFTANRASVSAFTIDATTGALTLTSGSPFELTPLGIAPFMAALDGTGKFLYVADTGNNGILGFAIDATTGVLTLVSGSPFAASSVFDLVANPAGPELYVQIGNSINVFGINTTTGQLTPPSAQPKFFTASNLVIANVQ